MPIDPVCSAVVDGERVPARGVAFERGVAVYFCSVACAVRHGRRSGRPMLVRDLR